MDQLGARKLLSRISQVDSKGVTQTWDASNNLLTRTDAEGRVSKFTYNATRQRITMTEAFGTPEARTTTYEYLSPTVDLVTKEITASVASGQQRQRIVNYNPNRTIASITIQGYKPDGTPVLRTTTFLYNTKGQVTKIDGPRTDVADVTLFSYYECSTGGECGQLATMTNALGHVTYFNNYDAHGRLTQKTDPNGLVTNYSYDLRGRLLSVQEGNRTTSYTYDLAGQLATVSAPNGRVLTYQYDAAHDVRSITDNAGNKITYTYDLRGNRATEDKRDPLNALTEAISYTYDLRNRIDTINSSGSITDLLFDKIGNLKQNVDANNHSSTYGYDALRRLRQTIDASSNQTNFSYGNQGLTLVQAPNGALTGYAYDDLGNLLSSSSPDTGTQSYTYDAAGNRTSMTDSRGVLTSYTYDAINRISSITYPTTSLNRTFVYDAGVNQKGRLTSAVDAGGTTSYAYDVSGATTTQSRTISGHTFTLAYGYDTAGQLSTMNYPSSGRNVAYTRNALGQITAVSTTLGGVTTTVANQVQYLPFGAPRSFVYGNGIAAERHYDQQYRLDLLRDVGAATLRDYSYTYDAGGNIDRIQDNLTTNAQDIGQDVLDRVISDTGAYGALTYIYDSVGNRTQRKRGAAIEQTITYAANGNRLDTLNGLSFTYDAAGNTLFDPVYSRAFTYDDSNRLTELRVGGVLQATYLYASNGQRIKTTEATGAQRRIYYHYGLARELIGETFYNSADQKIAEREYIWVGSLPLAFTEQAYDPVTGAVIASQLAYLHPDHLGTPRLATNPSQQLVWQWSSDAFGVGTVQTDPDGDMIDTNIALRLPGQHFDAESGLSYNYYRDYDPSTGRYLESDPLGLEGGLNTYLYSDANPLIKSDPTGENPAAVRAAFWTGTRIGGAISYGIQAATGATIGALIYDACHDDPNECDEKYVECLLTSLSDKPGGVSGQTRCAFCRGFCERQRKWPTRAPTTTGSVRCDYWNYSRVPE